MKIKFDFLAPTARWILVRRADAQGAAAIKKVYFLDVGGLVGVDD